MLGTNRLLAVGALVAGLLLPAQAMAAYEAITRVDLNLRVGPSTTYGVIDVIPAGHPVTVIGCLDAFSWCDVDFVGLRGWVAASYLVQPGTAIYLPQWAPRVGLPVISFSFGAYHDRHYRARPWHRQRTGRWRGRQEVQRPRQRIEQRQRRPQVQQPRQRQRTEQRQQRREVQRERRQRTEQRQQRRQRTEQRQQRREVQRERRQRTEQPRQRQRALQQQQRRSAAESPGRTRGGEQRQQRWPDVESSPSGGPN